MIRISGQHSINKLDDYQTEIECDITQVSDGYHTIDELYDHRCLLFLNLCLEYEDYSWKSKYNSDGTPCYDGYFIVGIEFPKTGQITYHIPMKFWHLSVYIKEHEYGHYWDGHTSETVLKRLEDMLKKQPLGRFLTV